MKSKLLFGIILVATVVAVMCLISASFFVVSNDSPPRREGITYPECNVVIYSDKEFAQNAIECLAPHTSKVVALEDISETMDEGMILFDENWIYENDRVAIDVLIKEAYENGRPVLFMGSNNYLNLDSGAGLGMGYALDGTGYGIYKGENGVPRIFGYGGKELDKECVFDVTLLHLYGMASMFI